MTVLFRKDKRYSEGRKPIAISYRQDSRRYVRLNRSEIFEDEVLIILMGSEHLVTTLDEVLNMKGTL